MLRAEARSAGPRDEDAATTTTPRRRSMATSVVWSSGRASRQMPAVIATVATARRYAIGGVGMVSKPT
jgi:hypothetical protein